MAAFSEYPCIALPLVLKAATSVLAHANKTEQISLVCVIEPNGVGVRTTSHKGETQTVGLQLLL